MPELVYTDNINNVPQPYRKVGQKVEFKSDHGETREFRVTHIENGMLTLDGNHPLAGKEVIFSIQVINVRDATDDEIRRGHGIAPSTVMH